MSTLQNCLNLASPELRDVYEYEFKKWQQKNPEGNVDDFLKMFEGQQLEKAVKRLQDFQENELKIRRLEKQFKEGNEYLKSIDKKEISMYEFAENLLVDRIKITKGQEQGLFFKLNNAQTQINSNIQQELERIGKKYNVNLTNFRRDTEANIKIDNDIIIERAFLNGAKDVKPTENAMAKDIAKMLNDLSNTELNLLKKAGIEIGLLDGYAGKQSHNPYTLYKVGFEKWYNDILPKVDLEKSYFMSSVESAKEIYKLLTKQSNSPFMSLNSVDIKTKLAYDDFKRSREIFFNSTNDYIEYNSIYGDTNSQIMSASKQLSGYRKQILTKSLLGTNPKATMEFLTKDLPRTKQEKIANLLQEVLGTKPFNPENAIMASILSSTRTIFNGMVFGAIARTTSIFDRVSVTFNRIKNIGFSANDLAKTTISSPVDGTLGTLDAYYSAYNKIFKPLGAEEKKFGLTEREREINYSRGVGVSTINYQLRTGMYSSEALMEVIGSGIADKTARAFESTAEVFSKAIAKIGALEAFTNISEKGAYNIFGADVYQLLKKDFKSLNATDKNFANKLGLDEEIFNILKRLEPSTMPSEGVFAKELNVFEPSHIRNLTNEDLLPILEKKNKEKTDLINKKLTQIDEEIGIIREKINLEEDDKIITKQKKQLKSLEEQKEKLLIKRDLKSNEDAFDVLRFELENQLQASYTEFIYKTFSYKTPVITSQLAEAGTFRGEVERLFLQIKTFPILFWRNHIMDLYHNNGISGNQKAAAALTFVWGSLLASYIVEQENELFKGNPPRELDEDMLTRIATRGSLYNLVGISGEVIAKPILDYALSDKNVFDEASLVSGFSIPSLVPVAGRLLDYTKTTIDLSSTDKKVREKAQTKAKRLIKNSIPANNSLLLQPILEYTLNNVLATEKEKVKRKKNLRKTNTAFTGERREPVF